MGMRRLISVVGSLMSRLKARIDFTAAAISHLQNQGTEEKSECLQFVQFNALFKHLPGLPKMESKQCGHCNFRFGNEERLLGDRVRAGFNDGINYFPGSKGTRSSCSRMSLRTQLQTP